MRGVHLVLPVADAVKSVFHVRQHLMALFIAIVLLASVVMPAGTAYAEAVQASEPIGKPVRPTVQPGKKPVALGPIGGSAAKPAKVAAADARPSGAPEALPAWTPGKPKITPHELTDRRTATSSLSVNADGTMTQKHYMVPKF